MAGFNHYEVTVTETITRKYSVFASTPDEAKKALVQDLELQEAYGRDPGDATPFATNKSVKYSAKKVPH